jgi:hypothetical protein
VTAAARSGELSAAALGRSAVWRYRKATAGLRVLPDFVIIGAQRSGTTSLYDYLLRHPQVIPAHKKEVHFYDLHHARGVEWYRANFPLRWQMRDGRITGEATPNYLVYPQAAERLHAVTPNAKLIALLRNPVDRAHSAWRLRSMEGSETASFEEALAREMEQADTDVSDMRDPRKVGRFLRFLYLAKSRYPEQLERWWSLFARDQMLIVQSEELFTHPDKALGAIADFLAIERWQPDSFRTVNEAKPAPIDAALRARLVEYFAPHNARLEAMVGRSFDWT